MTKSYRNAWLLKLGGTCVLCLSGLAGCSAGQDSAAKSPEGEVTNFQEHRPPILATNLFYYYEDLPAAWRFYSQVLGFPTIADYGFAKMLQVGPSSFLTLVDQTEGMHDSSEPKSVTLAIITDEVEEWWAYLQDAGVDVRARLTVTEGSPHDGFVAIDPEGYYLEFERFNPHPENRELMPVLAEVDPLYAAVGNRPGNLGVRGTVSWLYYDRLGSAEAFYEEVLDAGLLVDQGWAKVYSASPTGFIGLVDSERGLHQATEQKAVTVSFFTSDLKGWVAHLNTVEQFTPRTEEVTAEGNFARIFIGYDPEGYFLEWDQFTDVEVNRRLQRALSREE